MRPYGGAVDRKALHQSSSPWVHSNLPPAGGIGRPQEDVAQLCLQSFSKADQETLPIILQRAADAAQAFVTEGLQQAMNRSTVFFGMISCFQRSVLCLLTRTCWRNSTTGFVYLV